VTIYRSVAAGPSGAFDEVPDGVPAVAFEVPDGVPAGAFEVPDGVPVTGVSLGHRELSEADHWILSLTPAPVLACTHLVREPFPHVAVSLADTSSSLSGVVETRPALQAAADLAADLAAVSASGRAVIFPGAENLVGTLRIADVLALSAIERIEVLGGEVAGPEMLLETHDFVRPQYRAGQLILTAMPSAGRRLVPFETRHPTPCCAGH
jgi:hypothetical protein